MNWTPEIVRSRFVEACDTERRLPRGLSIHSKGGFWPEYVHSFEDMTGWGAKRLAEEREMRMRRTPPSAAAITRFEEVMRWSAEHIHDDKRRQVMWAWAGCRMSGFSFSARCKKNGWVKMTAYRRVHAVAAGISHVLVKEGVLLRMPDEKWVLPETPTSASNFETMGLRDEAAPIVLPTFEIFDGDRPRDMLTSPQAIEEFATFLEETNGKRRLERERREAMKRKKLAC